MPEALQNHADPTRLLVALAVFAVLMLVASGAALAFLRTIARNTGRSADADEQVAARSAARAVQVREARHPHANGADRDSDERLRLPTMAEVAAKAKRVRDD